jgi:hypothetical protein
MSRARRARPVFEHIPSRLQMVRFRCPFLERGVFFFSRAECCRSSGCRITHLHRDPCLVVVCGNASQDPVSPTCQVGAVGVEGEHLPARRWSRHPSQLPRERLHQGIDLGDIARERPMHPRPLGAGQSTHIATLLREASVALWLPDLHAEPSFHELMRRGQTGDPPSKDGHTIGCFYTTHVHLNARSC